MTTFRPFGIYRSRSQFFDTMDFMRSARQRIKTAEQRREIASAMKVPIETVNRWFVGNYPKCPSIENVKRLKAILTQSNPAMSAD